MRIIGFPLSALALVVSHAAFAQQAGSGGFTFKRMPVPSGAPKITVQIDPEEQARLVLEARAEREAREARAAGRADAATAGTVGSPDLAVSAEGPAQPILSGFEWFWAAVPSELASPAPTRVSLAMAALEGKSDLAEPRLQTLQDIANVHGADILRYTVGTDVSPALVLALISVESSGRSDAESHAGAQGLMQLIPATAERFGVTDSTIPGENIKGGVAYLAWLLEHFSTDPILALAGYNAGEGAVATHGGVPPFAETRAYVPKVLSAWRVARGLCLTPPQLLTDGCVFAGNRTVTNG